MGKKSRLKSKKAAPPNVTDNQNGAVASKEEQILSMCREYVSSFKPLIELKNENQKLKRAIIPNDFDTLMKHYVAPFLYRETMVKIRSELSGHKLFVSFTNSCNGHCFCDCGGEKEMIDVIIGTLKLDGPGQAFIINSVPKDNESPGIPFFVKLFIDSVKLLWPDDDLKVHSLDIILFITDHDEERYKAFVELHTALYPQLHYHECVDSSFVNEIEDFLKYSFEDAYEFIDDLVIFLDEDLKGMSRSELCSKYNFTSIPNAIFSRNFIEMSFFVYDNYNNLIKYLEDISPQSTCSELLKKPQVKREFAEIKDAFSSIVSAKKFLKT